MRDTIFISHATPEDNEFTVWLASRLELLGYKVWIDKKELLGGETFWENIALAIKNNAAKFLLVYSKNICYPGTTEIKGGIQKEIDFARQVIAEEVLQDFFIILHMDNSGYDLFSGASDLNQIPFTENWAEGLAVLHKKLIRDNIVKANHAETDEPATWYLSNYLVKNPIIEQKELYYTNWWSVETLPDSFFILRYKTELHATTVAQAHADCLLVRDGNCITTFQPDLIAEVNDQFGKTEIIPSETFEIRLAGLRAGYEGDRFPSQRDAENHFKKLLKRALHNYLKNKGLFWYDMANKNQAYYHTYKSLPSSKVKFEYPFRESGGTKTKNLLGKHLAIGKWHLGVSAKTTLSPFIGFYLRTHLIFSEKGFGAIDDKDLQHSQRRKKGKRMFNEEWRDLFLGFLDSLKGSDGRISLNTDTGQPVLMKRFPETFWSEFGYRDPKDWKRQELFVEEEREEADDEEQELGGQAL